MLTHRFRRVQVAARDCLCKGAQHSRIDSIGLRQNTRLSFARNQNSFKEDTGCIGFHEKAFKLKMKFIFIWVGYALGSGFHADSVWWSRFRSNLAQRSEEHTSELQSLTNLV